MNSKVAGEFSIYSITNEKHCEIEFGTASPHELVVANGLVDEVGVDEQDGGVQEATTRL